MCGADLVPLPDDPDLGAEPQAVSLGEAPGDLDDVLGGGIGTQHPVGHGLCPLDQGDQAELRVEEEQVQGAGVLCIQKARGAAA